ncbi:twin-arginine translocase TatA/TatE family subunit [Streptomyces sp. NBC_00353]|uniref:twin-arginine translocase TatA/TatE family subunit n=1 Tax=Streptomyces sp. NBC_00353 TaxID=2975722 RepID=UPI002E2537CB
MFFDIGPLEVVTLMVLAVILVGPDKLPSMVSATVRNLRKFQEFSQSTQESIRSELPAELRDLTPRDLSPRSLVSHLLTAEDLNPSDEAPAVSSDAAGGAEAGTQKLSKSSAGSGQSSTTPSPHR